MALTVQKRLSRNIYLAVDSFNFSAKRAWGFPVHIVVGCFLIFVGNLMGTFPKFSASQRPYLNLFSSLLRCSGSSASSNFPFE